jgi:hypothetical protein
LALTNFSKGRGGTFDKEVPHLLCTGTLQDEVQRTLALGSAKGEDDPIIVAACNVCDIIDVNGVVLKTNENSLGDKYDTIRPKRNVSDL